MLRSPLSGRATALWCLLLVLLPPVTVVAWAVLGRAARRDGRRLRRDRPRGAEPRRPPPGEPRRRARGVLRRARTRARSPRA
ncbi:PLDc N-terminal domain-containing protein [Frigoribacterium salinisoli]